MRRSDRVTLGLSEHTNTPDTGSPSEARAEVEPGGRWFVIRMIVGVGLGAGVGHALAVLVEEGPSVQRSAAFWGGFIGYWIGMLATVDVRDGRLVLDRDAFSATWGLKGWARGTRHLASTSAALKQSVGVGLIVAMYGAVLLLLGASITLDAQDPRQGDGVWITFFGVVLIAGAIWLHRERLIPVAVRARRSIGTALIIVGIGIVVFWMPTALRYSVQPTAGLNLMEAALGGLGAMTIAGGWFLRQAARNH